MFGRKPKEPKPIPKPTPKPDEVCKFCNSRNLITMESSTMTHFIDSPNHGVDTDHNPRFCIDCGRMTFGRYINNGVEES